MSESIRHPLSFYESTGEIELGRGDVISTIDLASFPGSYPVYSSSAVGLGEFGRYGRYMFDEELITWSIDGGGRPFHRKKHRFSVTNVCGFLRIKRPDLWDYRYLHALLEKLQSGVQFDYQMKAHPSVIREIYQFERAPIAEQRKIGQILDTLDTAIRATEALIDKLKAVKQGLLHDLLTRGIDANGQLRPPQSEAPQLYKASPLGWIPREWEVLRLDKVAARGSGHTPSKDVPSYWNGGMKWVSLADSHRLDQIYIHETDKEISALGIANSSAVLHPEGTVILSRDAGIGKSAILGCDMAVSQHFMAWRCEEKMSNIFLYYYLQREKPKFEAIAMGSTIKTIGLPFFKSYEVAVPPRREQDCAADMLMETDHNLAAYDAELEKLRQQKVGLMDDLLTGRVRVTPLLAASS